jgi:hypothetical protein
MQRPQDGIDLPEADKLIGFVNSFVQCRKGTVFVSSLSVPTRHVVRSYLHRRTLHSRPGKNPPQPPLEKLSDQRRSFTFIPGNLLLFVSSSMACA